MATYKEIKGVTVQTLDSDPVEFVGSWASGGSLNTAREAAAGAGTQTAAIMFGGSSPAPGPYPQPYYIHDETESYDGTTFTEVADLNTARMANRGGFGTSTAGFLAGGYTYPPAGPTGIQQLCESWNGSAWSETTDFNTKRYSFASSNSSPYTSAIITGGFTGGPPPSQINDAVETWNGSSWTETTETNSPKGSGSGAGISSTAAIVVGPPDSTVESWDGSSWTEVAEMTTTRSSTGSAGTYTSGLWFGGPSSNAKTESWNGTSWTELNDLSTGRSNIGAAGGSSATTSSLAAGGSGVTAVSEEWSFPPVTAAILTEGSIFLSGGTTLKGFGKAGGVPTSTWSSGGNLNTARKAGMGAGKLSTSAILAGGETPPSGHGVVETYDGTSYTEVADLNDARGMGASDGTQTAAIVAGGTSPGEDADTEIWDGSSWTEVANLNSARYGQAGAGTTTSLVAYGGYLPSPGYTGFTESWNGTSWTEVADLNTKKYLPGRAGTSNTDAFAFGGLTPPPTATAETWNGTSWTEVGDLNTARYGLGGCGLTTFAIAFGGEATKTETEAWNGTSWTEINEMASGRRDVGMAGSAVSGLCMGGDNGSPPAGTAVTEEFNATAGLANITVS